MSSQKRKKILFLITKSNWGGAQRYVFDIATHLSPAKFEPVVVLGGNGVLKEQLEHAAIRVISIDSLKRDVSVKNELAFAKELYSILRNEKPDVLHVNSSKAGAVGTFIGRLARVPRIIFTAHGWAFNEDRPFKQKMVIKILHWVTVLLSHKTIAVSTAIVAQMNWPFTENKMKIINPGRTIGVMYDKNEARQKLATEHTPLATHLHDTWIITIAELHPIKRLENLITAVATVATKKAKVRAVIIGEGEERNVLEALIAKNNLTENIFLVGHIVEAARFLKAGDLFILPSKSESYGYVLHEAGLAKLPVIATNVGGITDIIDDGINGHLVSPENPQQLASKILECLENKQIWHDQAEVLHEKMSKRNVDKMVVATEAVYELSLNN